jgi:CCR4-NOT transcription complex subunit 3
MEKFKAVEKAMKTKAYSKEGLSAAAKLDPKEQAKVEASEFLSGMVDELEQQIETLEAESESIQATMKKGKNNNSKAERIAEIEGIIERHKFHQGKMELIRRSLENGGVEPDQVTDLEESIRWYVSDGMNEDFIDDDEMYNDLELEDEEGVYGMNVDTEKNSSLDTQSIQDDLVAELELSKPSSRKQKDDSGRRSASQVKSPLPALATLHTPLQTISNGATSGPTMKPAAVPARPAGETLKYASAAAAAAASDKNNVGIAPLPPPPGFAVPPGISPLPSRASATSSPAMSSIQLASREADFKSVAGTSATNSPEPSIVKPSKRSKTAGKQPAVPELPEPAKGTSQLPAGKFRSEANHVKQHLNPTATPTVSSPLQRSPKRSPSTTCLPRCKIWLRRMKPRESGHFLHRLYQHYA